MTSYRVQVRDGGRWRNYSQSGVSRSQAEQDLRTAKLLYPDRQFRLWPPLEENVDDDRPPW